MISKVKDAISRYNMLEPGEAVAVALSGGADSVSLLSALKALGYGVCAIHVNHNLRGEESFRDERFCKSLCDRLGVPIEIRSVDVKGYCEKNRLSQELGARELRYEALYEASGGKKIALAHSLSDCLETSLFSLARGSGLHGLASIPPVRGRIIRPLIGVSRDEIEKYLHEIGLDYVTDSTNLVPDCSRNIIRLKIIPELEKITPGLMKSFSATVAALREADFYIETEANSLIENKYPDFSDAPDNAVLSRALAIILQREGIEPSSDRILSAKRIIKQGGRINIKKGVYLLGDMGRLSFERPEDHFDLEYLTDLRHDLNLDGKRLIVTEISHFDISHYQKKELRYIVDSDKIAGEYTVRHLRGGEKIRLAGRNMTQEIKKLLNRDERRENFVIADGEGAIYIEGVGVSERVSCGPGSKSALKIEIKGEKK